MPETEVVESLLETKEEFEAIPEQSDEELAQNFVATLDIRVDALKRLSPAIATDIVAVYGRSYDTTFAHCHSEFLETVAKDKECPTEARIQAVQFLLTTDFTQLDTDVGGFDTGITTLNAVYDSLAPQVSVGMRGRWLLQLVCSKYRAKAIKRLNCFSKDVEIAPEIRYKILLDVVDNEERALESVKEFFQVAPPRYKVVSSQLLLSKNHRPSEVIPTLLMVAKTAEYNERADACDTLLRYTRGETNELVRKILHELGGGDVPFSKNAQNVHNTRIEESALKMISRLIDRFNGRKLPDLEKVEEQIRRRFPKEKTDVCDRVLQRIRLDRNVYVSLTLREILVHVYAEIRNSPNARELFECLVEEFEGMDQTCSSGYAFRLVNTLSGYLDYALEISFEDQISDNVTGRLNAILRNYENMDNVLVELADTERIDRVAVNKFVRENIGALRTELFGEFSPYMSDEEFDIAFRKGIDRYISAK